VPSSRPTAAAPAGHSFNPRRLGGTPLLHLTFGLTKQTGERLAAHTGGHLSGVLCHVDPRAEQY
jgi:hypothetical protein